MPPHQDNSHSRTALYWYRTRQLTGLLLAIWFAATFLVIFFARELSEVEVLGWPVSFYMAAQGLILIYLALIGIYTLRMQRLDTMLGHPEEDDEQ